MNRRTKIVATLGPATDDVRVLKRMLSAGVDVVRVNFSHGKPEDHGRRGRPRRESRPPSRRAGRGRRARS